MTTTRSLKAGFLALLLVFGGIGAASADSYRYGHHRHSPPARHYQQDHRGNGNVIAALVIGGLIGATIFGAASQPAPAPVPVYVAPPAPQVQQMAYFCPAVGEYYPNISSCPGGWQTVEPSPRW